MLIQAVLVIGLTKPHILSYKVNGKRDEGGKTNLVEAETIS